MGIQKKLGKKIIVYVANITDNKNQRQLVECAIHLPDDVKVFLFGQDGANSVVRDLCTCRDYVQRVFLAGFCSEISDIFTLSDINMFLSKNDGFGLSIIEAYSYGVPCVMFSDLDSFDDLYNPQTMIAISDRKNSSVIDGVLRAIKTQWDAEFIRNYSNNYSLEVMSEKYNQLYMKVKAFKKT